VPVWPVVYRMLTGKVGCHPIGESLHTVVPVHLYQRIALSKPFS